MALPTSGNLSFSQILTEFNAPVGTKLSQLYRGGGIVPNIAANANVPVSGPIAVRNFLGASNTPPVTLTDFTVANATTNSAVTSAAAKIAADGKIYKNTAANPANITTLVETWNTGGGAASGYELRATLQSGSQPTGTYGVWQPMSSDIVYQQNSGSLNVIVSSSTLLEIRAAGGGAVLASCVMSLSAEKGNGA